MPVQIYDYHASRTLKFIEHDAYYSNPREGVLYLGAEVETDVPQGFTGQWNTNTLRNKLEDSTFFPLFFPTHDGSLANGCEFVSYPLTIAAWMDKKPVVEYGFKAILESGLRSHETTTCGLHVHVSRIMTPEAAQLIAAFIDNNWGAVTAFSRRGISERFAKAQAVRSDDCKIERDLRAEIKDKKFSFSTRDRYSAVNLTKVQTVEFRMFKGTLNVDTFYATLQFAWNCTRLCRNITPSEIFHIDMIDVVNYKRWPELDKYVASRDLNQNRLYDWEDNGREE